MPNRLVEILVDPLWLGAVTWGAGLLTLVGLWLTYSQARNARKAAEAARTATARAMRHLNQSEHLAELGEAGQLTLRIKEYAAAGNPEVVRLGLEMLRGRIDSLEATAAGDGVDSRERRTMNHALVALERHVDEVGISPAVHLDPMMISSHLNEVRRVLSRRVQRVKRSLPEEAHG